MLESKRLISITSLFAVENVGAGAPTNNYTSSISQLLQKNIDAVGGYIRKNHANADGLQKRSTSYTASGTSCPLLLSKLRIKVID